MPLTFETWYAQHNHNGQTVKQLAYAAWLAGRDTLIRPAQMQPAPRFTVCPACDFPQSKWTPHLPDCPAGPL